MRPSIAAPRQLQLVSRACLVLCLTACGPQKLQAPAKPNAATPGAATPNTAKPDEHRNQDSYPDAKQPAKALLARLSRGSSQALKSALLEIRMAGIEHRVALEYPKRMRLETVSKNGTQVATLFGGKHWVAEGLAPDGSRNWEPMTGKSVRQFEELRLLLGSVLAWDWLDAGSLALPSNASWWRQVSAPIIERDFDAQGRFVALRIDGRQWKIETWHEDRGALLPELRSSSGQDLRFQRISLASKFLDDYFRPEQHAAGKAVELQAHVGGEEPNYNFKRPVLEASPAVAFIDTPDPADWSKRFAKLRELGNALGSLGQAPSGLPGYVEGKLRIYFGPAKSDGTAKAPEGYELGHEKAGHVLVIHRKIALKDAAAELEPLLRAHAKAHKFIPCGSLRLRPELLPRPGVAPPAVGSKVLVRAELPVH